MFYTYILRSLSNPAQRYIGHTADLRSRLDEHNSGKSPRCPWRGKAVLHIFSLSDRNMTKVDAEKEVLQEAVKFL